MVTDVNLCCVPVINIALYVKCYMGFPDSSVGKESACNAGEPAFLSQEDPLGEGIGYPLQYSWASLWLSW